MAKAKTASKAKFLAELAKHKGATAYFEDDGRGDHSCWYVDAPAKMVWTEGPLHGFVAWKGYGATIPMGELYADLIERMAGGLEPCTATGPTAECECNLETEG